MPDINTDATRAEAARRTDIFLPVYPTDDDEGHRASFQLDEDGRTAFDAACEKTRDLFPVLHPGDAVAAVARSLVDMLPRLGVVMNGDEKHSEFLWARARCLLAGFGWHMHRELATRCTETFEVCDLDPDEEQEDWMRRLTEAHRMCGWPVGLALLQWRDVSFIGDVDETPMIELWQRCVALLHILKHVRRSATHGLVVTYRGTAARIDPDRQSSLVGGNKTIKETLLRLLNVAPSRGKSQHAMTQAVSQALGTLTLRELLVRAPTSSLPGVCLVGPWSTVVSDPQAMTGIIPHGLRLSGVWLAAGGEVRLAPGDTDDVMSYDWNIDCATSTQLEHARFLSSLPKTYDTQASPHRVLLNAFPNVRALDYDADPGVFACLFDAVMCSGLLAHDIPDLAAEKPLVLCMPAKPSLDESTNQGKSKCAAMLARALAPGIPSIGVSDTDDAAGRRSLAAIVAQYGTLCAQEWKQPRNKAHLLTHENLQILLTGGSVVYGRAYENEVAALRLTYPMFADAKALDVPPDIVNRALILWMDRFTEDQRGRSDVLADLESGRLSILLRLAALSTCERHHLRTRAEASKRVTSDIGWRFPVLRAIARILWEDRFGPEGLEKIDQAIAAMREKHHQHTSMADENGVLAVLEAGAMLNVRLYALFDGITSQEVESIAALLQSRSTDQGNRHGASMQMLLRARADATGFAGRPLMAMAESVVGARLRVSDRVLAIALAREIRSVLPTVNSTWAMPDHLGLAGWRLTRRPDVNGAPRVTILPPGNNP